MRTIDEQVFAGGQRGLTLVEIMVALAIGVFILAGISQLYVENKHSFRVQESITMLEENSRFALDKLGYALRMAGHFAGVDPASVATTPTVTGNSNTGAVPVTGATADACNEAFVERVNEGFKGYSKKPPCIAAADWVAGSDAFVVRFADPAEMVADSSLPVSGSRRVLVRTEVAEQATMFEARNAVPAPAWRNGVYNFPYNFSLFFIRPCSAKAGSVCAATDDGGKPVPTLVRVTLDGNGGLTQEPLVEGVEMMKLRYGRDTDGDGDVDVYQTAAEIASAAVGGSETPLWNEVKTVQIALVARGLNLDVKNSYDLGKYNVTSFDGTNTILENMSLDTFVSGLSAMDLKYPRSLYTTVVELRNR